MEIQPFQAGKPIPAARLNLLVDSANRFNGIAGGKTAFAGGFPSEGPSRPVRLVAVVGRTILPEFTDGYAPLHAIEYTLNAPGIGELRADYTRRIVDIQPDLVRPASGNIQLFWPAAVVGSDEGNEFPWRTRGELFVGPDLDPGGVPRWFVRLWGESPYQGC